MMDEIEGFDCTRIRYLEEKVLSGYDLRGHMGGFQFVTGRNLELILNLLFQRRLVLRQSIVQSILGKTDLSYHVPNLQVVIVHFSKARNPTGHHIPRRNGKSSQMTRQ
jgi:hypothetical protein